MRGFGVSLNCGNIKFSCGALAVSFTTFFLKLTLICDSRNYFVFPCSKKRWGRLTHVYFLHQKQSIPNPLSCVIAAAHLGAGYSLLVKWF